MSPVIIRYLMGAALSAAIAGVAWRRRSLSPSGVLGAFVVGTVLFGAGGLVPGSLLIAFFVSSSALSHFKERDARKRRAAEMFEKGGRRDLGQVLANGGAATIAALAGAILGGRAAELLALAVVGALATVNADTWATELGVLARRPPRLITKPWRTVEPGTSGGVSLAGTLAALAGATFIGAIAALLAPVAGEPGNALPVLGGVKVIVVASVSGLAGALADSLLGATVQAIHARREDGRETEQATTPDGVPNPLVRGLPWLHNDGVNFLASVAGALAAIAFA